MAYSSNSDLLKRFTTSELAKLSGDDSGTTIDTDRTDIARDLADATIDSTLQGNYKVPFVEPDPLIASISIDLTIYHLYRIEYGELPLPSEVTGYYHESLQLLDDLRVGDLYLGGYDATTDAPPTIVRTKSDCNRIYSGDVLNSYFGGSDV